MENETVLSQAKIEAVPEQYQSNFENLVEYIHQFPNSDNPEAVLQDLMQTADSILSTYSNNHEQQPEPLKRLDEKLWDWFKDPPTGETFIDVMNELTSDVHEVLASVNQTQPPTDKNPTEPLSSPDDSETQNEEKTLTIQIDIESGMLGDFLAEAKDELQTLENLIIEVEENPTGDQLNRLYRAMHTLKGGFGICNLENCSEVTHFAEDLLDNLREDPPNQINENWMKLLLGSIDFIRTILSELKSVQENDTDHVSTSLTTKYVNQLKRDLSKAASGKKRKEDFDSLGGAKKSNTETKQSLESDQVKVDLNIIDEVVDLIGELVISQSELSQQMNGEKDRKTNQVLSKQQKIMNKLQRKSMDMRMLPINREFRKFPRIVRDLADELDKQVDLTIEGETTEIDKSILDQLEGPLMHLVRNAIDHGIEKPSERTEKGKPSSGQLSLRAYHESGQVYIEVEEDGRGLPTEMIENKAIDQGLIDEKNELSNDEIHTQILKPGFSTADEVSNVSGRGVGMDVVNTKIESLQGNLMIDSQKNEGTRFTLELPLTVAIIDGLVTRIGPETIIIPANQIEESVNPDSDDLQMLQDKGRVYRFRDEVVPVVDPRKFLSGEDSHDTVGARTILVVVDTSEDRFALWVDELKAHQQIVIKQMDGHELNEINLISGGAILGDGSVGLILDLNCLARQCLDRTDKKTDHSNQKEETNVAETP